MRVYFCIDLKTFYASVECVLRGLDPFKTNLVVADKTRGSGAICLAVSPKLKMQGVKNRCRLFEIPKNIKYIIAKPRMKKYMDYSALIHKIYLKYVSKNDVFQYSIDEAFLDVSSYLKLYNKSAYNLAKEIIKDIKKETGITAACGIGTNLYLAKIALDIIAKHNKDNIAFLNEEEYKKKLWYHEPLSDFWQIGIKTENKLNKLHLKNMHDISQADEKTLYKTFGINAKLLIDHSLGIEPCTIKEIKAYKPKSSAMSNSQILDRNYDYKQAKIVLEEMIDNLSLRLVKEKLYTNKAGFYIGYEKRDTTGIVVRKTFENPTDNKTKIIGVLLKEYNYVVNKKYKIRKLSVFFTDLEEKKYEQINLFSNELEDKKENKLSSIINEIKEKYGSDSVLKAISILDFATQKKRNKLIGGHNAE